MSLHELQLIQDAARRRAAGTDEETDILDARPRLKKTGRNHVKVTDFNACNGALVMEEELTEQANSLHYLRILLSKNLTKFCTHDIQVI